MVRDDIRALLHEQRMKANETHTSIWTGLQFFYAIVVALLGLSAVLQKMGAEKLIIAIFPLMAIVFSVFGILVLVKESEYFLESVYATSWIRSKLDLKPFIVPKDFKKIGIDTIFKKYSSAEEYAKTNKFRLRVFGIRALLYWVYILLVIASVTMLFLVLNPI